MTARETRTAAFRDDFRGGLDTKWAIHPRGGLPDGDGIVTLSENGLVVTPTGTDPVSGAPAFAATAEGRDDHIKWAALIRRTASSGFPGFDVPAEGALECSAVVSAEATGVDRHPFGTAVADPWSDLRLAVGCLVTTDFESHVVFDFGLTNSVVYALYERVPAPGATYAAFSYAVPVADRAAGQWHTCRIRLDRDGTRLTWLLDGREVLVLDRIGHRAFDRAHLLIDHGGVEETVRPRQLAVGLGTFTTLDGAGPDGRGLVRLDNAPDTYFSVGSGAPALQEFVDATNAPASRIWGAGTVLRVGRVDIEVVDC